MNSTSEEIKRRLSSLTPAQRAALARRVAGGKDKPSPPFFASAPIPRESPLRVDTAPDGSPVAIYPASNSQQRVWFLNQLTPDSAVYASTAAFQLHGPLDRDMLEVAIRQVIQRHGSFRTTFTQENRELVQRIASTSAFSLEQLAISPSPEESLETTARRCLEAEASRSFDLQAAPPFRAVLVSLEADRHVLLFVMHHIITDGWSVSNLCRELSLICAALAGKFSAALPELPIQYADYAAWQQHWLKSPAFQEQEAYWKRKLEIEPEPLNMMTDQPRPAVESYRGSTCTLELSLELASSLKALAQERQSTLFMVLLAVFQVLLYRYTGQTDLLVGVPIANRQRSELENLMGYFANTLVMRTGIVAEFPFVEFLERVKETALEAYEHQDMPFELIVQSLQVRRDASRSPLFQSTFALRDFPAVDLQIPGLKVTPFAVSTHTSKFDLSLAITATARGLTSVLEFNTDLFEPDHARRMLEHWQTILADVVAHPHRKLSDLCISPAEEKQRLLVDWNRTEKEFPGEKCLHDLFSELATRNPDSVAVKHGAQQLTYRELELQSNDLAHKLQKLGVESGTPVGLCLERSSLMLVAMLGILKAGGAYVPLDPHSPPNRLALILEDAEVSLLLTQRSLLAVFADFSGTKILLDEQERGQTAMRPEVKTSSRNVAYVIYTSGSTGRPKGVVIEHRSVVNLLAAMRTRPGLQPQDIFLGISTISFDMSVPELFLPLTTGACLVLVPDDIRADGVALGALLEQSGATVFQATPTTWKLLLQSGWKGDGKLKAWIGAEALPFELAQQLLDHCAELWNFYGPTETTVWSLVARIEKGAAITIGKPLPNTTVYIVDRHGQPSTVDLPGELWIGGAGVARGYLKRPELNAERFVLNPFVPDAKTRLYRTGDLCRWRANGTIEFLGRIDSQVKLRGFRIELGEIEAVLSLHPDIQTNAVIFRKDREDDPLLHAFLVIQPGATYSSVQFRAWLKERLPDYMIPSRFTRVDELPRTLNGKLDQAALMRLEFEHPASLPGDEAPQTRTERVIAKIWEEVLNVRPIGIRRNFFDLGGHSLLAVTVTSRVNRHFDTNISLRWVFENPTVADLAACIQDMAAPDCSSSPFPRTSEEQALAAVWDRVLQSGPSRVYDNFFQKDGDPVKAQKLIEALSEAYGFRFKPRDLTSRPTIAQMLELIRSRRSRKGAAWLVSLVSTIPSERIVPLRKEGSRPPLFVCPGGWVRESELVVFAGLLRHLPQDLPVYGMKQDFSVRATKVQSTVSSVARNFLSEIRKIQPEGPYYLLGECISSVVMLEIAHQLAQAGQSIGKLILLDPRLVNLDRVRDNEINKRIPRKVARYHRVMARGPLRPSPTPILTISPEEETTIRQRIGTWPGFDNQLLFCFQVPGDHHSYLRDHSRDLALKIGALLQSTQ